MKCHLRALLSILIICASCAATDSSATEIAVIIDNSESPVTGRELEIKHQSSSVRFEFVPDSETPRCRYKLEGLDPDWLPQAGEANLIILFFNKDLDQIQQSFFPARGESEGWNGTVEKSSFTDRDDPDLREADLPQAPFPQQGGGDPQVPPVIWWVVAEIH